ncbi:MAG: tRNA pseudouridine(38-40) synthase TruA [Spirochaetes bacterium]|nr:MAG: tRNA pseudouridine(38-40) synthase TruA [Spirochaetota bacterium]
MGQRNIRVVLAYDGNGFYGWQYQKKGRTVQGVLMEALARMHHHPIKIYGSSRTDSGVHATGQVANFITDISSIKGREFARAINSYLPSDIKVLGSEEVDMNFHSRFNAKRRTYKYQLLTAEVCPPQYRNYCFLLKRRPDVMLLNRYAASIVGSRDFTTFSAAGDRSNSKVREVYEASFYIESPYLIFKITANAFLWKMVRSILGTMLELEKCGRDEKVMEELLAARDRNLAGETMPARGLFLTRVEYDE